MIGPPSEALRSYSDFSVDDAVVKPRDMRRSVMLLPCRLGADPLTSALALKVLPPALGTAFITTPLVPVSPIWPDNCTSTCSNSSGDRLMLVRFELWYMLPMRRPSS